MRILHVIGGLAWRFGGTSTAVLQMTDALAGLPGVEVEIATTDADGAGGHLTDEQKPKTRVPVHYFRHDTSERWKVSLALRSWLRREAKNYQLIHIHGVWSFSTRAAARAARRAGIPYIIIPHGMLSPYTFSRSAGMKRLYWILTERRNVCHARCLHLTTQAERDELATLRLGNPTRVIPLGVEAEAWTTPVARDQMRARWESERRGRPVVLFLSRLHPKKGLHDILLPAFAPLREKAYLVIAGGKDGHEASYEELLKREIATAGLQRDVLLAGEVPAAERFAMLDAADLFVLPSRHENFGIVVAEAMARRRPVLVSKQVQCSEHVERADAGRVLPLEPAAFRQAIEDSLGKPAELQAQGERGHAYVREHLHWPAIALQLQELYQECIEDPRLPQA